MKKVPFIDAGIQRLSLATKTSARSQLWFDCFEATAKTSQDGVLNQRQGKNNKTNLEGLFLQNILWDVLDLDTIANRYHWIQQFNMNPKQIK